MLNLRFGDSAGELSICDHSLKAHEIECPIFGVLVCFQRKRAKSGAHHQVSSIVLDFSENVQNLVFDVFSIDTKLIIQ